MLLAILFVFLVVRERHAIGDSLAVARRADIMWLVIGFAAMAISIPCSTMVYRSLVPTGLPFWRTTLVQAAGFCVNKLLPSGSGAIGVSYVYLRAQSVAKGLAAAVVAVNNGLGFVGHSILFFGLVVVGARGAVSGSGHVARIWLAFGLVIVGVCFALYVGRGSLKKYRIVGRFVAQVEPLLGRRTALLRALLFSMGITICYIVALFSAAHALGLQLTLPQAMIALSGSVLATSVIPVPGGIGAAEAGVYAGLVLLGFDTNIALAVGILYRVLTFWMPLLFGSAAFVVVSKRGYLSRPKINS